MHFTLLDLFSLATPLGTKPLCVSEAPQPGYWESEVLALREGKAFAFYCVLWSELLNKIKSQAS